MTEMRERVQSLRCPDCQGGVNWQDDEHLSCTNCGRLFSPSQGIWDFLPLAVGHRSGKDREREGWSQRVQKDKQKGWVPPPEFYLSLPDYPHPYYRSASWFLRIVVEYAKPWQGKDVLELGAAECWATRRFAEAGARAVALDYDPDRMLRAQVLLDRLPVDFLRVRGDAERLPFRDGAFDRIFCCSVLHHFFDLPQAVREIARTLKPGGMFIGIHEAFHPPYYRKSQILRMHEDTIPNIEAGINEQSFPPSHYRRLFEAAGMECDLLHPAWDARQETNGTLTVRPGIELDSRAPGLADHLRGCHGPKEALHRFAGYGLRLGLWASARSGLFPRIRFHILNLTTKEKILVARKPS